MARVRISPLRGCTADCSLDRDQDWEQEEMVSVRALGMFSIVYFVYGGSPERETTVSTHRDPCELPYSELSHQADSIPELVRGLQHKYSRGHLGLASVGKDEPNPR